MSNKKRISFIALALAVLLVIPFASCSKGGKGSETTPRVISDPDTHYKADIPDEKFDGAIFRVGGIEPGLYPSITIDFDFDEGSTEVISDSIYNRNRKIEETLGIEFANEYVGNHMQVLDVFNEAVYSDEDYYQLIMLINRHAFAQTVQGFALRADQIDYINLDQPWYMSNVNDAMNICGKQILAYSDECLNAYLQSICLFFNMDIVRDKESVESPYDLINADNWTLDKFYELAENAQEDVNGDGLYDVLDGDIFGVLGEVDSFFPSTWIGAGATLITKDKQGTPLFSAHSNEKLIGILERLEDELSNEGFFCDSNTQFTYVTGDGDTIRNEGTSYFADGGSLFRVGCVGYIQLLRDMDSDFGVIPLPKYDEKQTTYYSRMCDGWIHIAPATVTDTKLLGCVLESLGAESKNYVIPAFFDTALENKYIRDEDRDTTEKMLNMIFNNATIDLSDNVWHEVAGNILIGTISAGQGDYASALASQFTVVSEVLKEAAADINALD